MIQVSRIIDPSMLVYNTDVLHGWKRRIGRYLDLIGIIHQGFDIHLMSIKELEAFIKSHESVANACYKLQFNDIIQKDEI